jgi:aminobenzoyl-glutamate utilization protein B
MESMRLLCISLLLAGAALASEKDDVLNQMNAHAQHYGDVSRKIWEFAEVGYKENKSAELLKSELRQAGFTLTENVAGIPTAFTASYGQGKPVIAIMGEYDALPSLSQDTEADRKPIVAGGPGHGCGHNLLGTASLFAAITVKDWLVAKKIPGTIRFYGTPAEEGGGGKIYMARAGVFKDVDVVLAWHPGDSNSATKESSLAITEAKFRFYGKPAHAAAAPDLGRSALDGLMIMANAVEFLREHVPESTRIHYIITSGGAAPNIVPEFAELFLYARNPSMPVLDGIWERIVNCAKAGALATDTRMEMELIDSDWNTLPNDALSAVVDRNLHVVGGVTYTKDEEAFAEKLRKTVSLDRAPALGSQETVQPPREGYFSASTDAGDVSWMLPTSGLSTATFVPGIPAHSWQATACAGSSIGRKGMVVAAKTLALSAMDLFTDPTQVAAAKASFEQRKGEHVYKSRVPDGQKPPLNYRDKE